jgi:hypothetical protein
MAHIGPVVGAAAAARRRQLQEEEETMTPYSREELDNDFEFKIVRANSGAFGNPETFARLLEEEARAGWQLLEKLDNSRVRFKRPASTRQRDALLPPDVDPYRVHYGLSENAYGAIVAIVVFAVFGLLLLIVLLMDR